MPRQSDPTRQGDSSIESSRAALESRSLGFALLLVITGAAGLLAAWVITIDKFKLLE
ncbi:vitamin K epoxide reductase family protein, partial [Streptomyces sp. NPDC055144]